VLGITNLAQDRGRWRALVNVATKLRVVYNVRKFLSIYTTGSFHIRAQLNEVSYSVKTRWRLGVSILPMIISQDCKTNHSMRNKYEDEKKKKKGNFRNDEGGKIAD
jgi:hypothetical protein